MDISSFGFTAQPGAQQTPQMGGLPFSTPAFGANPMASFPNPALNRMNWYIPMQPMQQQPQTPNGLLGLLGAQMMQPHQQPGQQQPQPQQFGGLMGPLLQQAIMNGDNGGQIGQRGAAQQTGITGLSPWLRDAFMKIGG